MENGQKILIKDLKEVLGEAENGEFGDFTNEKYPAPKIALAEIFYNLRQNVIKGKYD